MDISEVNRQIIYRPRSAGSIYRIHSKDSDFDYFGICCIVALPVEEASLKPKRRLLDFDESDKESDPEADDLVAELTRFCLNFMVSLLKASSGRNEPNLDKELDPLGWWRNRSRSIQS